MHSVAVLVNWDSSNIVFIFGDVESDPGPRRPNENPMYCIICSTKIKRGIQQETAPSCTVTNCQLRCHQACNGLTVAQICHVKSCGHHILWKCSKYGSGIAEIVIPPPPSATAKSYSVCSTPIWPRYADLAYYCTESSCPNVWHLILTCNRFFIPRSEARQRELANPIWKCHLHTSTVVTTQADQQNQHQEQQQQ